MLKANLALVGLFLAAQFSHAEFLTVDFRSGGSDYSYSGSGYGNSINFYEGDVTVNVTSFAETGVNTPPSSSYYLFENAQTLRYSTGLGVCNRQEGTNCGNPLHQVDNIGRDDLVAFVFDHYVDFRNITIDPYGKYDRDIAYWVGNTGELPDLTSETFTTIGSISGFSDYTIERARPSSHPYTHDLSGTGNILLISAHFYADEDDRFKIANVAFDSISPVTPVPIPASAWLFFSALVGLIGFKRKQ